MPALYMVFDVESIGLHGEGFAVGAVVVNDEGGQLAELLLWCDPDAARGTDAGRAWVAANCGRLDSPPCTGPLDVREQFWSYWTFWQAQGALLVADCAWPVEARFLAACVDDHPTGREWGGPYPLHDVATARMLAGFDPLATVPRLPDERPEHTPLPDARQSARLWLEALAVLRRPAATTVAGGAEPCSSCG